MDNQIVMDALNTKRPKNRGTHALLVRPFELQVAYGFMLSLKWIPTAVKEVADAISWPSRDVILRIAPASFQVVWDAMGPFKIHLMACTASVLGSPLTRESLPFSLSTTVLDRRGPTCLRMTFRSFRVPVSRPSGRVSHRRPWRNVRPAQFVFCRM